MADSDRELQRMLGKLQCMSAVSREQVLEYLSPAERVQLKRHLVGLEEPQASLSRPLAELIESLRDGTAPNVTAKAREAVLAASLTLGNDGIVQCLKTITRQTSLIGRFGRALGFTRA